MDQLSEIRRRLLRHAHLFDEPDTYAAGVDDALDAVERRLHWGQVGETTTIDLTEEPTDGVRAGA